VYVDCLTDKWVMIKIFRSYGRAIGVEGVDVYSFRCFCIIGMRENSI
jgi:hypothetical protein